MSVDTATAKGTAVLASTSSFLLSARPLLALSTTLCTNVSIARLICTRCPSTHARKQAPNTQRIGCSHGPKGGWWGVLDLAKRSTYCLDSSSCRCRGCCCRRGCCWAGRVKLTGVTPRGTSGPVWQGDPSGNGFTWSRVAKRATSHAGTFLSILVTPPCEGPNLKAPDLPVPSATTEATLESSPGKEPL